MTLHTRYGIVVVVVVVVGVRILFEHYLCISSFSRFYTPVFFFGFFEPPRPSVRRSLLLSRSAAADWCEWRPPGHAGHAVAVGARAPDAGYYRH